MRAVVTQLGWLERVYHHYVSVGATKLNKSRIGLDGNQFRQLLKGLDVSNIASAEILFMKARYILMACIAVAYTIMAYKAMALACLPLCRPSSSS